MAPHVVGQALKGAILVSYLFKSLGYEVLPQWNDKRGDIIQCIRFASDKELIAFCQAIQQASPVDGHVTPVPWRCLDTFIRLLWRRGPLFKVLPLNYADAPITPPYTAYLQGGLTYAHVKFALASVISQLNEKRDISV